MAEFALSHLFATVCREAYSEQCCILSSFITIKNLSAYSAAHSHFTFKDKAEDVYSGDSAVQFLEDFSKVSKQNIDVNNIDRTQVGIDIFYVE